MRKSFTLIELLIALVIIGILVTIAIPQYNRYKDKAVIAEAKIATQALADSIWMYYTESGTWPPAWSTPPYGTGDPFACPVDLKPGVSKYWVWSIESSGFALPGGNQAVARVKNLNASYLGYGGLLILVLQDGTRLYGWRTQGGWVFAPAGQSWPF